MHSSYLSVLQQDKSDDFVLASGEMHSVREFVEKAFAIAGITIRWEGYEVNEVGVDAQTGKIVVRVDREPSCYLPDHMSTC